MAPRKRLGNKPNNDLTVHAKRTRHLVYNSLVSNLCRARKRIAVVREKEREFVVWILKTHVLLLVARLAGSVRSAFEGMHYYSSEL